MLSSQQQIITEVATWLSSAKPVWLCTILKTWGSSPRPIGAMMACTLEGELVGSVSGGCIEEDFVQQLRDGSLKARFDAEQKPFVVQYGMTEAEQARLKLPCGGQLHVLLEYIEPTAANQQLFSRLQDDLEKHHKVSRVVDLASGAMSATQSSNEIAVVVTGSTLSHSLSPMYRLLLLGAGDVAKYVAEMAIALEYDVTLCDPRPNYLDNWAVAGVEVTARLPDDVVRDHFSNPYSGIIALAHDPRVDDMALMEALKTEAFYIGAMGSERTSAARRQRLPELGLSEAEIALLHAPIGFQINSKTPAEIAIAIMAEVTAVRHKSETFG
ncbi:MAG: xanthine dehydrogenase accessory factor [Pseudohongiellaceae bacterium]|jgi:xanthine dehydrogenase accessory factor